MPKKTAKTTAKKVTKQVSKKLRAKRPVAKKAAPRAKAKVAAPAPKTGFMWTLLERKQAEIKRREAARAKLGSGHEPTHQHAEAGHARFNGPRRRAA